MNNLLLLLLSHKCHNLPNIQPYWTLSVSTIFLLLICSLTYIQHIQLYMKAYKKNIVEKESFYHSYALQLLHAIFMANFSIQILMRRRKARMCAINTVTIHVALFLCFLTRAASCTVVSPFLRDRKSLNVKQRCAYYCDSGN